jgi:flagellum-specific ATP synthase
MPNIVSQEHMQLAQWLRQLYSRYQQNRDLIAVGAYSQGSDPATDLAIEKQPAIRGFLQQGLHQSVGVATSLKEMAMVINSPSNTNSQQAVRTT